jgi:hypothetical protein
VRCSCSAASGLRAGSVVFRSQLELLIDPATKPRGGTAQGRPLASPHLGGIIYLVSPAGSGSAWFRGARDARIDRSAWMLPWLFPVGLLGAVVLISLSAVFGYLLAAVWGWLVFPCVALYIRSRSHARRGASNRNPFRDADAHYWRTRLM